MPIKPFFSDVEWELSAWVLPSADPQGILSDFLKQAMEKVGRRHLTDDEPSATTPMAFPLDLLGESWSGHHVAARALSSSGDAKHSLGNAEIKRLVRLADEMDGLPPGAAFVLTAWVGSSEMANYSGTGELTFEPEAKLVLEQEGALRMYSMGDALIENLNQVLPVRQGLHRAGHPTVDMAEEVASIVKDLAQKRLEAFPHWLAYSRQARLDHGLPQPASPPPKPRF